MYDISGNLEFSELLYITHSFDKSVLIVGATSVGIETRGAEIKTRHKMKVPLTLYIARDQDQDQHKEKSKSRLLLNPTPVQTMSIL